MALGWAADRCCKPFGEGPTPPELKEFEALAWAAKHTELGTWKKCDVCHPAKNCAPRKPAADACRVLTREEVYRRTTASALLVATGLQKGLQRVSVVCGLQTDPELQKGLVAAAGCVNLRRPHLHSISLSAFKTWELWSLDVKTAFP